MLLAPVVLAALLAPAPQEAPPPSAPAPQESPSGVSAADLPTASSAAAPHIDAGLAAFKKRHFAQAEAEFRKAEEADPQSAAAAFYLGYTYYKIAEPKHRLTPDKQKAAELFAKAFAIDPNFKPVWQSKK
jgi:tetratricopeptide (TPR) repeat protein